MKIEKAVHHHFEGAGWFWSIKISDETITSTHYGQDAGIESYSYFRTRQEARNNLKSTLLEIAREIVRIS